MKRVLLFLLVADSFLYGEDYGFSMDELDAIKTSPYEYNAYIKGEHKYQILNDASPSFASKNKNSQNTYLGELFFNYKYFQNKTTLHTDVVANYKNIDNVKEDTYTINQAYVNYKYSENHQINIGKLTPKWGKGYFFNPSAFIDRKKDPNEPEASKEGFTQLNYKYNKVFNGSLQNLSFDVAYLPTTNTLNNDGVFKQNSNTIALKTYMLYRDIDIDLIYAYNDKSENKAGFDFSTNLRTNFEIHGEYGRFDNGYYSYLWGIKYLTEKDLTILSEYYYQNENQANTTSFWDKRYLITKFTQKEPFDILYYSIYFRNSSNLDDASYQNKIGILYTGIKNLEVDLSFSKNYGNDTSEFGTKLIDKFSWLSIKYSF